MPELSFAMLVQILIPATVFIIMICLGLELSLSDFQRVLTFPRAILTGVVGQMILMPAMAFAIAATFGKGNPVFQIGLVLLAACPGGPLSNSFVYLGRARVDLSVSLTAVNGFLALVTTPLIASVGIAMFAGEHSDIHLPVGKTVLQIFLIAILPVAIGMFINFRFPRFTASNQGKAKVLTLILLVIHMSLVIATNFSRISDTLDELLLPAILYCSLAMALGYFSAFIMGLDRETRFTIGIEVGLQNVVVAILIANVILKRPEFALFVLTYAFGVLFVMIPWILIHRIGTIRSKG
jgi:BASS family bile acid:Na+ symporter